MRNCLMFPDAQGRLGTLVPALRAGGYAPLAAGEEPERVCAREAERGLALIGAGEGSLRALLLAERYNVAAVVLIGCPLRPRDSSPLRRRAEHNLFCVVGDVLVIQPLADASMPPRGADVLLRGVSSRVRRRLDLGEAFADLWTSCKQPLVCAVLDFLDGRAAANALAQTRKTW